MSIYFLADLHLDSDDSFLAREFCRFLREEPKSGDRLVLGGDIFDLLVGGAEVFRRRYGKVLEGLRMAAASGVRISLLEGNHDFQFASLFAGLSGISVEEGDLSLRFGPASIWVSHGDLIDPEDRGYRMLRWVTKSRPFRSLIGVLPGAFVNFLGSSSSGASRRYTSARVEGEGSGRIRRLFVEYARARVAEGHRHVLLGHSHFAERMRIEGGGHRGEYLNLGYRADRLVYAVLRPGAEWFEVAEAGLS